MKLPSICILIALLLAGCDNASNSEGEAGLRIGMQIADEATSASTQAFQDESLILVGSNGTLTITDIGLIVSEFELDFEEDTCDNDEERSDDACERFELPPSFVDLPLPSGLVTLGSDQVPAGEYKELEFEVEDAEDDGDRQAAFTELLNTIRARHPEWPPKASMVVEGSFAHIDGSPIRPFKIYVEAEIEVEMEFNPPLVIDAGDPTRSVTVEINPANWFKRPSGTVFDLSQTDYEQTRSLLEFTFEMENGFSSIEFDD